MSKLSQKQIADALSVYLQGKLKRGETVEIDGLGTFTKEHRPSQIQELPDGQITIQPPQDIVVFKPKA